MSDAAITSIVTGLVTIVTLIVGFGTLWLKMKYGNDKTEIVSKKIDANTVMTKKSADEAIENAKTAATAAAEAKLATKGMVDSLDKKLNGGIDGAVNQAVEPLRKVLDDHTAKINELNVYVHQRNHDILTTLQAHSNKLEIILRKIGAYE